MSKRTEAGFDVVAELLIKLKAKKQVQVNEIEEAIKRYNAMFTELHHYRSRYGSMQQQGQNQPKVSDNGQSKVSKETERLRDLEEENVKLKRHVEELKHRLSVLAGQKLIDGNPDIADLSDPYRPTSIAEKFSQLYDDDWTDAYSVLEKTVKVEEQKIIQFLAKIVMEVDQFCFKTSESQSSKMRLYLMDDFVSPKVELPDGKGTAEPWRYARKFRFKNNFSLRKTLNEIRDFWNSHIMLTKVASTKAISDKRREETATRLLLNFRKSLGTLSVQPLIEIFNNYFMKRVKEACKITSSAKEIDTYVAKTIELVWMMKIQSPPMELEWKHEGDKCNKNRFTFYRKSGDTVKKTVWPALLLHKDGPLVSKGVVECL